jgi:hypothetical protein
LALMNETAVTKENTKKEVTIPKKITKINLADLISKML